MRSDLDGAAIDAAMARYLTREQIRELGVLFAGCVAEMVERRAARLAAQATDADAEDAAQKSAARG